MKVKSLGVVLALLVGLLGAVIVALPPKGNAQGLYVKVLYVIDGDTIKVLYHGHKVSVRLIGIDTPESRRNRRAYLQARHEHKKVKVIVQLGQKAKAHLKQLVKKGDIVRLEFDIQKYDRYGRLLAYVWKDNEMLNMRMICDGYAYLLTIPPNVKYAHEFRKCFEKARMQHLGLFKAKN